MISILASECRNGDLLILRTVEGLVDRLLQLIVQAVGAEGVATFGQKARNRITSVGELATAPRTHQFFEHVGWICPRLKTLSKL